MNQLQLISQPPPDLRPSGNGSGLHPLGRAVLILPLDVAPPASLIQLPAGVIARMRVQDTEGYVVELGPSCEEDEGGLRCKVGDRVAIAAMSGTMRVGQDGQVYRVVNHRDIYLTIDEVAQ